MEEYEEKLGLIAQHQNILRKTEEIGRLSEKARTADPERAAVLERISALAREIAEEV